MSLADAIATEAANNGSALAKPLSLAKTRPEPSKGTHYEPELYLRKLLQQDVAKLEMIGMVGIGRVKVGRERVHWGGMILPV